MSEVCSEWTPKKLFVYVFLYAVQSMTPHTGCMIVLLNYINVFCSLHFTFFLLQMTVSRPLPFPCSYPRSELHHCWSCSLLPLPRLYSLLNHPAVIDKHITHPQFLHIASSTVYISFDVIVIALAPVCLHLLHTHNRIIIIRFTKHCTAEKRQVFFHQTLNFSVCSYCSYLA